MLHIVILAGGTGTRFWPASRASRPKQVLPLLDGQPLIATTLARVAPLAPTERTWLVAGAPLLPALRGALPLLPEAQFVVEPEARNTAPSIFLAAARLHAQDPDAVLVVLPSDQAIGDVARFQRLLERAVRLAQERRELVTLGIVPTFAATGYGWLEGGEVLPDPGDVRVRRAVAFHEKPTEPAARRYLASGRHFWNSGIFVWRTQVLFDAVRDAAPACWPALQALIQAEQSKGDEDARTKAFRSLPATSIDYALMEHARNILMVEADVGWDDLGSFAALRHLAAGDNAGNRAVASAGAAVEFFETGNCTVYAEGPGTVVLSGVQDLIVVKAGDVTLLCRSDGTERVKELVAELRRRGRTEIL